MALVRDTETVGMRGDETTPIVGMLTMRIRSIRRAFFFLLIVITSRPVELEYFFILFIYCAVAVEVSSWVIVGVSNTGLPGLPQYG